MDLILDFETLGQSVIRCPILNCSLLRFDRDRFLTDEPYSYDELLDNTFHLKLDVAAQVEAGYKIEPGTIAFWEKLGPEAQKQLKPSKNDLTYSQFCDNMMAWIGAAKIDYWWSRSNTFDPILLWRIFEDVGRLEEMGEKLKFWKVRDIRTYIDAKTDFNLTKNSFIPVSKAEWDAKFIAHDSRHDIVADVLRIQKLVRLEQELP